MTTLSWIGIMSMSITRIKNRAGKHSHFNDGHNLNLKMGTILCILT